MARPKKSHTATRRVSLKLCLQSGTTLRVVNSPCGARCHHTVVGGATLADNRGNHFPGTPHTRRESLCLFPNAFHFPSSASRFSGRAHTTFSAGPVSGKAFPAAGLLAAAFVIETTITSCSSEMHWNIDKTAASGQEWMTTSVVPSLFARPGMVVAEFAVFASPPEFLRIQLHQTGND